MMVYVALAGPLLALMLLVLMQHIEARFQFRRQAAAQRRTDGDVDG